MFAADEAFLINFFDCAGKKCKLLFRVYNKDDHSKDQTMKSAVRIEQASLSK